METTLYDDNMRSVKKMKTSMTLDLNTPVGKPDKLNDILGSPDMGLLMLASPDLERFIIQQNGLVLTTPTPTSQILCPKSVTEEQEAYARGFVDALGELHRSYGLPTLVVPSATVASAPSQTSMMSSATTTIAPIRPAQQSSLSTTTMLPESVFAQPASINHVLPATVLASSNPSTASTNPAYRIVGAASQPQAYPQVKVETAQTVPSLKAPLPPICPINMDDQELAKLERKRARNRVAATRCRNRKLERISRLQERVKELQDQNVNLARTASTLRDQVCRLKQNIIEHTKRGCQLVLTHNLL